MTANDLTDLRNFHSVLFATRATAEFWQRRYERLLLKEMVADWLKGHP